MEITTDTYRFTVRPKRRPDEPNGPAARSLAADAHALGLSKIRAVHRAAIYFVHGTIAPKELSLLGRFLFCDSVVETCDWSFADATAGVSTGEPSSAPAGSRRIEVALRPGVTDPVADEALRAARELGITGIESISTGYAFDVEGDDLGDDDLRLLAERLLCNAVIQYWAIGGIGPQRPPEAAGSGTAELIGGGTMGDDGLLALSAERRAALDLVEMSAIRAWYRSEKRACTDAEFETIAQTWSEHCVHKTFKALIEVRVPAGSAAAGSASPYPPFVDNVLKSYIKKATDEIAAPWVLSAFVDNAGILEFDGEHEISFKVETHNHPSAIEPFGGANTGVGGVIRDVMGVSARPIAATDVLCFGVPETRPEDVPAGSLHPRRIINGVIAGVQDYGNKMGVPTVNGGIHYDPGYAANPLVYCGCAGIAPKGRHPRNAAAGDRVVVLGGRTGRDGLRGATFSSMVMDSSTGELSGASVQIGAPIVQKKVSEALLLARDAGLYSAITDCGAGGLSSAVGEMASELGADVDLARAPLKYHGLAPWEIWLSEAQERMVVAVPPPAMEALRSICVALDVELTDLGHFTGNGRLVVRNGAAKVIDLDCGFLHSGPPQRRLVASPPLPVPAAPPSSTPASGGSVPGIAEALLAILAHPAVASKEATVRLYDHEVQGATILRPYDGIVADGPQDAAVLKPRESKGSVGIALSNGFNHRYGAADPYRMAVCAVDEAVRNAVAVGTDPDRIAVLDNFCLGDPKRPETMWTLIESARGCYDAALVHCTPFVSGKDSFNNEYLAPDGTAAGARVSIPPSLLISAIGIVPDIGSVPGSDFKAAGNPLYLVGGPVPSFGGSVYAELFGIPAGSDPAVPAAPAGVHETYRALHQAIAAGLVRSCHDLSDGGLAVAVAEMCMGGRIGASIEAGSVPMLFGETNGCLVVEVDAAKAAEFEKRLAGVPCSKLGATDSSQRLAIAAGGRSVELPIADLIAAFSGARSEE